jgi:hypothetical protein
LQRLIAGQRELRAKYPGVLVITKLESELMTWGNKYKYIWYEKLNGIDFVIASSKDKEWFENEDNVVKVARISKKLLKHFRYNEKSSSPT